MGLRGMQERARRIGAHLTVTDRPGGGTVVEVSIGDRDDEGSTT
jgi:signal transduction histidine kinase